MNRRALLWAVILAIVTFAIQLGYLTKYEEKLQGEYKRVAVLIAVRDIPPGVGLDSSMVETVSMPQKYADPDALSNADSLFGQITAIPIKAQGQVTQTKLLTIEDAGLTRKIPPGHRALAVAIDEITGVGGHIQPANRVDIIGAFDFGDPSKQNMKTIILKQDVLVLSVGSRLGQAVAGRKTSGRSGGGTRKYEHVTVALKPLDVPKIALAQEVGRLSLALRKTQQLGVKSKTVSSKPVNIKKALGLPDTIYRRSRPAYREIRAGGY